MKNLFRFLKIAATDARVGAVMPSSRWATRAIMARVPSPLRTVIEYGPGDGVLTKELLARMTPDGKLLAIEANDQFTAGLMSTADARMMLVRGDAREAARHASEHGLGPADLVISGIPFSMLPGADRRAVVDMTYDLLAPGGTFLVYQTSPLMVPYLRRRFRVRVAVEARNVPPYFIMQATKTA